MKALIPTGNVTEMVRLADVAEPEPSHDQVLVAVEAFSLNRGETILLERPPAGWRPGKDIAGRVVREARNGMGPPKGARVVGHPPAAGWAERVAVPVNRVAELPASIDAISGAALPLAGLTALRLLRVTGHLAGRRMLLTGASGGVGHYLVELAAAAGAEITVVTATQERGERLRALGAARVATAIDDVSSRFDVVLESVGGDAFRSALSRLIPGGLLIWFGQASRAAVTLDFFSFFDGRPSATIRHFDYTDSTRSDADDLRTLVRLTDSGCLHPEVGCVASWREAPARIADLRERRIRGKAVLTL